MNGILSIGNPTGFYYSINIQAYTCNLDKFKFAISSNPLLKPYAHKTQPDLGYIIAINSHYTPDLSPRPVYKPQPFDFLSCPAI